MTLHLPARIATLIAIPTLWLAPATAADLAGANPPPGAIVSDAPRTAVAGPEKIEVLPTDFAVFATPEPSRAVLLAVGSLLLLMFYRRAWMNFRQPG